MHVEPIVGAAAAASHASSGADGVKRKARVKEYVLYEVDVPEEHAAMDEREYVQAEGRSSGSGATPPPPPSQPTSGRGSPAGSDVGAGAGAGAAAGGGSGAGSRAGSGNEMRIGSTIFRGSALVRARAKRRRTWEVIRSRGFLSSYRLADNPRYRVRRARGVPIVSLMPCRLPCAAAARTRCTRGRSATPSWPKMTTMMSELAGDRP